ncbi:ATP-binding protein [Micromonosporaceae bacterium Da 78-11]
MRSPDRRNGVRWTVGRMLTAGFAVALLALAVVGASAYTRLGALIEAQQPVDRTHIALGSLGKLGDMLYLVDRSQRSYFASRSPAALQLYRDSAAELGRTMDEVDDHTADDPVAQETLVQVRRLLDADEARADLDIADPRSTGPPAAERDAQLTRVAALVTSLHDHETSLLFARLDASDASATRTRWLILAVSAGTALFVAAAGRWITRRITSAAHEVTAAADRVIDGDLTRPAEVTGPLELAQMAEAVNASMNAMGTARDEAIAATAAKSAFLAAMSHEIRTPMNAVLGGAGLLDDSPLSPEQRELVQIVRGSAESLLVIINDILDFSKIEAGELDLDEQPVDLRGCVDDAMKLVALTADAKGLRLSVETAEDCPATIVADATRLRQILVNLLGNAVKFTDQGGVAVGVAVTPGPGERVRLRIGVRDTGIGIPADRLERLFVAFSQVDDSSTRSRTGTGLGLVISQRLAEAMGGGITVRSTPGEGSVFALTAYVGAGDGRATPTRDVAAPAPPPTGLPLHILLAEDNPINQRVAELMLTRRGHRVDIVDNGEGAVRAVRVIAYDLVLMDVRMPVVDGLEATRRIRADPPRHGPPRIVALTANATVDDQAAGRAAGMDGFLAKPIQESGLDVVLAAAAGHADTGRRLTAEDDHIRASVAAIAGADFADQARLAEILLAYARRLPDVLAELDEAVAAADHPRVDRLAHRLKGSSATLGAHRLARTCARLEESAQRRDTDALVDALGELHERADAAARAVIAVSAELTAA